MNVSTASLQLTRPKSLTDLAQESIHKLIVSGRYALGEQLLEASLAAQLGISKTPVREALLRLRNEGLIEIQANRGTFVFSLTREQVVEICGFRELMEVAALGMGMRASHAELVAGLDANVQAMAEAQEAQDWRAIPMLDQRFHHTIMAHSQNACLGQAYQLIASKISALRARLPEGNERVGHCQENHAAIVSLIRAGDIPRAQAALGSHIQDTLASYMEASGVGVSPLSRTSGPQ